MQKWEFSQINIRYQSTDPRTSEIRSRINVAAGGGGELNRDISFSNYRNSKVKKKSWKNSGGKITHL